MLPLTPPMSGKVYVTTKRIAVVLDAGGLWNVPWGDIEHMTVKKSLVAATAFLQTIGGDRWGVDSTKAVVRDIHAAWLIAIAR